MRYLIAHLLSGGAKEFHETLARDLSVRFHTLPLYERIAPHMTVKPPFEADEAQIAEVERVLRAFIAGEKAPPLHIRGFGRFGFRTVYLDVVKSPGAVALTRNCIAALNANVSGMPHLPREGNKLHASVARFLTPRQYRHIWRYLKEKPMPHFETLLDNLAILKKDGQAWKVHSLIAIPPERGEAFPGYAIPETHKAISRINTLV